MPLPMALRVARMSSQANYETNFFRKPGNTFSIGNGDDAVALKPGFDRNAPGIGGR